MTNEQIIAEVATALYGKAEVEAMLAEGKEPPLHTLQGWALRGFKVKRGEHAVAEAKLWKRKKRSKKVEGESGNDESDKSCEQDSNDFYLCRSFLFTADQVEEKALNTGT